MAEVPWLDEEEGRVFRAFLRTAKTLLLRFDRELRTSVGIPRSHVEVLWTLNRAPEQAMRMSDLAEVLNVAPSRASVLVSRLEDDGYVRRELSPGDRRVWHAVLTDEGLRALRLASAQYAEIIRSTLLAPLSRKQRVSLIEVGELILASLEAGTAEGDDKEEDSSFLPGDIDLIRD